MPQESEDKGIKLVSATNIGVNKGGRWIFRYVDLDVYEGELVYVVGANGSGKTTCIKTVLGLIACDEGSVWHAAGLEIGYVPQRIAVSPTLPITVRRMMNLAGRFAAAQIEAALEAVGLERLGDPQITTLSGGEFQRLLLARALIHKPGLLVLDEPDQGVDLAGSDALLELINKIRHELNCGVLMISHDLDRVMAPDSDVVVLIPHEHDDPLASYAAKPVNLACSSRS